MRSLLRMKSDLFWTRKSIVERYTVIGPVTAKGRFVRVRVVRAGCGESAVWDRAVDGNLNVGCDDSRCITANLMWYMRTDAASAKTQK